MQSVCNMQRVQCAAGAQSRKASVNALLKPCCATSMSQVRSPKPFTSSKASVMSTVARRSAVRPALSRAKASRSTAVSVRAEISYVMVKPDGVQRGLVGEIISRFERKGFKLVGLKLFQTPSEVAEEHYKDLKSKPFYPALVGYITSGPVVAMVWEGKGVVASARKLIGATNPLVSEPGTIRGDFAIEVGRNVIHGSDSPENGERETALWFSEGTVSWEPAITPWLKE